jgi:hypothetical protein
MSKTITVVREYTATVESRTSYEVPDGLVPSALGADPALTLSLMPDVRLLAETEEITGGRGGKTRRISVEEDFS